MRKFISSTLLAAGIILVGMWAWSIARVTLFQDRASQMFDEQVRSAPAPSEAAPPAVAAPPPKRGAVIGRLVIPRLRLRAMVREGADEHTLNLALGHVPGTALPGRPGNVGIAGHRDTLFRGLREISKDDLIVFQTTQGTYTYGVESTVVVKPQDIDVLASGSGSEITLVTCYPFHYIGPAPDRFIVKARLISPQPVDHRVEQPVEPGPAQEPRNSSSSGQKLLARRIKTHARRGTAF